MAGKDMLGEYPCASGESEGQKNEVAMQINSWESGRLRRIWGKKRPKDFKDMERFVLQA